MDNLKTILTELEYITEIMDEIFNLMINCKYQIVGKYNINDLLLFTFVCKIMRFSSTRIEDDFNYFTNMYFSHRNKYYDINKELKEIFFINNYFNHMHYRNIEDKHKAIFKDIKKFIEYIILKVKQLYLKCEKYDI